MKFENKNFEFGLSNQIDHQKWVKKSKNEVRWGHVAIWFFNFTILNFDA